MKKHPKASKSNPEPPEFSPGDEYDPANCLVSNGWRGLLLEADEGLANAAAVAEGATVLRMEVTPDAGAKCSVDHGGHDEQHNMEEKTIKTR